MKKIRTAYLLSAGLGIVLATGCQESFEDQDLKERKTSNLRLIAKTETDIAKLERDLEEIEEQAAPAVAAAAATVELSQQVRNYTALADELEPKIKENSMVLDAYQKRFQVKNTFKVGEQLGDFTLKTGIQIKGAVVTGLRGPDVGIRHASGIGYYSVGQLPDQFGGRILAGPAESASPVDVAALFDSKPVAMKTDQQIAEERQDDYTNKLKQRQADRDARLKEEDERQLKRKQLSAQLKALNLEIDQLNKAIYAQRIGKSNMQRSLLGGSIRRSDKDIAKQLAPFDQRIAALEEKKNKLDKQKSEFEAEYR